MVRLKPVGASFIFSIHILSQFHYGSIKTNQNINNLKIGRVCLNSTMVRLKLNGKTIKFRLGYSESQFHYGSIKTLTNLIEFNFRKDGLNSTMVRLKLEKRKCLKD